MRELNKCEFHFSYPLGFLKNEIREEELNRYPKSYELKKRLAVKHSVKENNILITTGAVDSLNLIFRAFSGKKVLLPEFTWNYYEEIAKKYKSILVKFKVKKEGGKFIYDSEDMINQSKKADVLFIPSPNNPSGTIIEDDQLKKVLKHVKKPVVIDAAFTNFSKMEADYDSLFSYYSNLVLIYSFSKFFGMPGLRVGYLVAKERFFKSHSIEEPYLFSVNELSQKIALKALDHEKYFSKVAKEIRDIKDWFKGNIHDNLSFYECEGNYILLEVDRDFFVKYKKKFKASNIKIKFFSHEEDYFLRIDVAPKKSLTKVLKLLNS